MLPTVTSISEHLAIEVRSGNVSTIGLWFSELSAQVLSRMLVLLKDSSDSVLGRLSLLSLYDYCDLPKNHDQSTCYQILSLAHTCAGLTAKQIFCSLHGLPANLNTHSTNHNCDCIILAHEFPRFPVLEDPPAMTGKHNCIIELDPLVRDYRSRFFERYANTPRNIMRVSQELIENAKELIILVDSSDNSKEFEPWDHNVYMKYLSILVSRENTHVYSIQF